MSETILMALRDYFGACPLMEQYYLNIGYLPQSAGLGGCEFSLDALPTAAVERQYVGGGAPCVRSFHFLVRSVANYGPDALGNLAVSGLHEKLARWMEDQGRAGHLPVLPAGMRAMRLEALSTGCLTGAGTSDGEYQIECALSYLQFYSNFTNE